MTTEHSTMISFKNRTQQSNEMSTKPLRSSHSPSPFGNTLETPLRSGSKKNVSVPISKAGLFDIKRTRSLDEHHKNNQLPRKDANMFESNYCDEGSSSCGEKDNGTTVATALHSSFDVSLLRGCGEASCSSGDITLFENGPDEDEGDSQTMGKRNTPFDTGDLLSLGKDYHPHSSSSIDGKALSYIDLKPPATVRKKYSDRARRRSSDSATTATTAATSMSYALSPFSMSKTPVRRLRNVDENDSYVRTPVASQKSPAHSSTAKRRRAPFAYPARQSPMRRVNTTFTATASASNTPVPFQTAFPFGTQQTTSTNTINSSFKSASDTNHPPSTQTPTHQNLSTDSYISTVKKAPYNTGTTTGTTQLETTFEEDADSVDTNSPARFRFTSFPASLPRVHHANQFPRSTPPVCPGSVRKRMSFDTEDDIVIAENTTSGKGDDDDDDDPVGLNYSNHQNDTVNQSRDDDGTHNTSLSSLSVEGGHHQHLPHLPYQHPPHFASAPTKSLLLFPGEQDGDRNRDDMNNNLFGYSDDEEDNLTSSNFDESALTSPNQNGTVRRTRLNFSVFLSPANNNKSKPNVGLTRPYDCQNRMNSFPSSLSSQTQINASNQTNEDNLVLRTSSSSMTPPRAVLGKNNSMAPETPLEVHLHFPLESECSPILGVPKQDFSDTPAVLDRRQVGKNLAVTSIPANLLANRILPKTTISSPYSSSYSAVRHGSQHKDGGSSVSSSESSTSTQKRHLRPMPDMSAFESIKTSSARGDRSGNESKTGRDGRVIPPLIRRERACPPTPQRTPAWANEGGHIFNSLITNKVLLSCPSQVLEGRSSLETSVLDEDSKASGSRRNSLSISSDNSIDPNNEVMKNDSSHREEDDDSNVTMDIEKCGVQIGQSEPQMATIDEKSKASSVQITAPPKVMRRLPSNPNINGVVSFSDDFEILGGLGSGAFADVYKVRLKSDSNLYAVKRNRRQFRGKRDRDVALAEVQSMQQLQSVFANHNTAGDKKNEVCVNSSSSSEYNRNCYSLYLLFFYRAWQEDGYFYSQTELCCRDTCREMLDSLRFLWNSAKTKYPSLVRNLPPPTGVEGGTQLYAFGRLVPNMSIWKICHDISAGLSHIHSHGIVHQDIKPSNIFFVTNARFGAMCKIGDFGLAGSVGSSGDGQEGDTRYLPPELLASAIRHTSSDIFSLGLTLFEIATDEQIEMPSEGPRWHQLRSSDEPKLPSCRGKILERLLQSMTDPDERKRPTADTILNNEHVKAAGNEVDTFLQDYIKDVEEYDRREEERLAMDQTEDQTPRNDHNRYSTVRSPSLSMLLPNAPNLFSPQVKTKIMRP